MADAVRVGMARGSIEVRLRPVGSTSARPRDGAPAGPGATRRPSSAATSAHARARRRRGWPPRSRRQGERLHRRLVGHAAEDMQAVADAEFLDVAELGVELGDGLPVGLALEQPAIGGEPAVPGAFDDLVLEEAFAPPVETVGRGIFLDDAFQLGQRPVQAGGAERRRQVADGDGGQAPLGLHRLARIVDDEGIDHRQRDPAPPRASIRADSASALPGSHSRVPCVPRWTSASIFSVSRSQA